MTRIRTASLATLVLLLAGCVTPSGIVDNFVPPQGQPVTAEVRPTPTCEEAVARDPIEGNVQTIGPCAAEVLTIVGRTQGPIPRPIDQRRPRPPRMRR